MLKQIRLAALMGAAIPTTISLPGYAVEVDATIEGLIVSAQRRDQNQQQSKYNVCHDHAMD